MMQAQQRHQPVFALAALLLASMGLARAAIDGNGAAAGGAQVLSEARIIDDVARGRHIPVQLYRSGDRQACLRRSRCPVALLSPGYGVPHTDYTFIAEALARRGYLVVAIAHDLPGDPPPTKSGDIVAQRAPLWERGAQTLRVVSQELRIRERSYDWTSLTLVGHSNGGDLSAYALRQSPKLATTLITLDNRRYPLPRQDGLRVLSIRGSDFPADAGVLPTANEQAKSQVCVLGVPGARHDDMQDAGPVALKQVIVLRIAEFLRDGACPT